MKYSVRVSRQVLGTELFLSDPAFHRHVIVDDCMSVRVSVRLSIRVSVRVSVRLPGHSSDNQFACPSISISLSLSLPALLSVCLHVCVSVCLPVGLLLYRYACLYLFCISAPNQLTCQCVSTSVHRSLCLFIFQILSLILRISVCPSVCQTFSLFVECLSVSLFVCLSVGLSICLSVCLSVCQSVCLSVSLFVCLTCYRHFTLRFEWKERTK